ncbi:caspase family protein [Paracoccaceae bacterium]
MIRRFFPSLSRMVLALVVMAAGAAPALSEAGRRLALVVGNEAYAHVPGLATPVKDAHALARELRQLDFEVTVLTDADPGVFEAVLQAFAAQAAGAETVLFYYAGHALQADGVNRLVPVSARLDSAAALTSETLELNAIAARLKPADGQLLIFLDACRTDPLPPELRGQAAAGLAQYDGGAGSFVAFATAPGEVAWDKGTSGDSSPFTAALLAQIAQPGQSLSDLMIEVRNAVETATGGKQTPWEQSSLRSQFYFVPQAAPEAGTLASLPSFDTVDADSFILDEAALSPVGGQAPVRLAALSSETRNLSVISALPAAAPHVPGVDVAGPGGSQPPAAAELPRAVQEELKRIGCYSMTVDGDWGNGSRNAMRRYYTAKKAEAGEVEPTAEVWLALTKEPEKTCKPEPVVAKKKSSGSTTKKSTGTTARKTAPAPAPAPAEKTGPKCKFMVVAIVCS